MFGKKVTKFQIKRELVAGSVELECPGVEPDLVTQRTTAISLSRLPWFSILTGS